MLMRWHACSHSLLGAACGFAKTSGLTPPMTQIADSERVTGVAVFGVAARNPSSSGRSPPRAGDAFALDMGSCLGGCRQAASTRRRGLCGVGRAPLAAGATRAELTESNRGPGSDAVG
jgi:hypothetical protein